MGDKYSYTLMAAYAYIQNLMYVFVIVFSSTLRLVLGLECNVCIPSLGKGMPRDDYQ